MHASWFKNRDVLTRAAKCGCMPLYHACALYSGIAEEGDGGNGVVMTLLFGQWWVPVPLVNHGIDV